MPEEEKMMTCPYNISHVIQKLRMPGHLTKCRKQFPNQNYVICPFDAAHNVPEPEKHFHAETCPSRNVFDSFCYAVGEAPAEDKAVFEVPVPVPSEDWDCIETSSYLERKEEVVSKQPILRLPVGQTKAERRDFFQNEVYRYDSVSKGDSSAPISHSDDESSSWFNPRASSVKPQKDPTPSLKLSPEVAASKGVKKPVEKARAVVTPMMQKSKKLLDEARAPSPEVHPISRLNIGETPDDDDDDFQLVVRNKGRGRGKR